MAVTPPFQPGLLLQPFVVSQLVGSLVEEIVAGSEVSASEFAVTSSLAILGTATPTELARLLGLSPTTLSAMLKRLVERGQVRRSRHPDDGRSAVLALTARGERTNRRNLERFAITIGRVRSSFGADPEDVLEPMRRLEAALRETLAGGYENVASAGATARNRHGSPSRGQR